MLSPDVQQAIDAHLAKTACPFCKVWVDSDEVKTVLAVVDTDGLMDALMELHELVCGEFQEGRRRHAIEAL